MSRILAMQELPSVDGTDLDGPLKVSTFSASRCNTRWSGVTWTRC